VIGSESSNSDGVISLRGAMSLHTDDRYVHAREYRRNHYRFFFSVAVELRMTSDVWPQILDRIEIALSAFYKWMMEAAY
jgi:hypothetical protein